MTCDRKQALAEAMQPAMRGMRETITALRAMGMDRFADALTRLRDMIGQQAIGIRGKL